MTIVGACFEDDGIADEGGVCCVDGGLGSSLSTGGDAFATDSSANGTAGSSCDASRGTDGESVLTSDAFVCCSILAVWLQRVAHLLRC
jgi:hypothetical protein